MADSYLKTTKLHFSFPKIVFYGVNATLYKTYGVYFLDEQYRGNLFKFPFV